mgnify:FL=1
MPELTPEELALLKEVLKSWDGWIQSERRSSTEEEDAPLRSLKTKLNVPLW